MDQVTATGLLSESELCLLGEVTLYGALIEAVAAGIHGAIHVDPESSHLETAHTSGMRVGDLLRDLRNDDNEEVRAWADLAQRAVDGRHQLVHTAWMLRAQVGTGPVAVLGMRSSRSDPVTAVAANRFEVVRGLCREAYQEGASLSRRLHRMA